MDIYVKDYDTTVTFPDSMKQDEIQSVLQKNFPAKGITAKDVGSAVLSLGAGAVNWIPEGLQKAGGAALEALGVPGALDTGIQAGEQARDYWTPQPTPGAERLLSPITTPLRKLAELQQPLGDVAYQGQYPVSELMPDVNMGESPAMGAAVQTAVGGAPFVAIPAALKGASLPFRSLKDLARAIEQKRIAPLREAQRVAGTDVPIQMPGGQVYPETPQLPLSEMQTQMAAQAMANRGNPDILAQEQARMQGMAGRMSTGLENQGEPNYLSEPAPPAVGENMGVTFESALVPGLKQAIDVATPQLQRVTDLFNRTFLPTARGESAMRMGEIISEHRAEIDRYHAIMDRELQTAEGVFNKMPVQDNYKFMQAMDTDPNVLPDNLRGFGKQLETMFKDKAEAIQKIDPNALQNIRQAYFPHIWDMNDPNVINFLRQKSMEGSKAFLRDRVYQDINQGIAMGLKPKYDNPIMMAKSKIVEMDRYLLGQTILQDGLKTGDIVQLTGKEKAPPGYSLIPEPWGRTETGKYAATDQAGQVIRNFYSLPLGARQNIFGLLYRGYMSAGNTLNQFQLMGPFHGGFVTGEAVASKAALAFKQLYRTVVHGDNPTPFIKSVFETPIAAYTKYQKGKVMEQEYYKPQSTDPLVQQAVNDYISGGQRFHMDKTLRTAQTQKMVADWYNQKYGKAVLRSPIALSEQLMKPIMQYYVPRVKAGAFEELMTEARRVFPNLAPEEYRSIARQVGNRIDARLGQVVYDKYFMENTARNVIQGTIRAPGWSGGTITELGGAPVDMVRFFKQWGKDKKVPAQLPDRVAYAMGLATVHATTNGILTYLLTGQQPTGTDFWAFRTGVTDPNGDPERGMLPTYGKDVYAYKQDTARTLMHKLHPAIGLVSDVAKNRDYYGTQIVNPEGTMGQYIGDVGQYLLKAFTPFFIRAMIKNREQGKDLTRTLMPNIGIMPAPSSMNQTPAERMAHEIQQQNMPGKPRTKEEFARSVLVKQYSNEAAQAMKGGNPLPEELRNRVWTDFQAGKLHEKDLQRIEQRVEIGDPLMKSVKNLSVAEVLRVYNKADDKERALLKPVLEMKAMTLEQSDPQTLQELLPKLENIFPQLKQAQGGT